MCEVEVDINVSHANDEIAEVNRKLLDKNKIRCVNIMGSPGAGKTTLIEGIAGHINPKKIAVIQGDLESDIDQKRLEKAGIEIFQINTHSGCHLNAHMVEHALEDMDIEGKKYLLIENVGNLVCPAGVNLGEHMKIVVSSTTEGSDKPKKYPIIFLDADAVVLSKMDLADAVDFDEKQYVDDIRKINRGIEIFRTDKNKRSFEDIAGFLEK